MFLYPPPNIVRAIKSRRMRWVRHVAWMGDGRSVYSVLVGMPEGDRLLGRPKHRWEDNIKTDLWETGINWQTGFGWLRIESNGKFLQTQ
jgi:hypothetical protein